MKIADTVLRKQLPQILPPSMAGGNGFANGGPGTVIQKKKEKDVDPEKKMAKK